MVGEVNSETLDQYGILSAEVAIMDTPNTSKHPSSSCDSRISARNPPILGNIGIPPRDISTGSIRILAQDGEKVDVDWPDGIEGTALLN